MTSDREWAAEAARRYHAGEPVERDCEYSTDGQHRWGPDEYDNRCMDCDRKPWYETATVEGRTRKAAREASR